MNLGPNPSLPAQALAGGCRGGATLHGNQTFLSTF